jgi:hypothetical protein
MTRRLSPVTRIGAWRIAALEEWTVSAWSTGRGATFCSGEKRPLAFLIEGPGGLILRSATGAILDAAGIEALLPGALADFRKDAGRDTLPPEEKEEEERR